MFSSRNASFASNIMKDTGGHGIDVIINLLTGELLDALWCIVADGGTMVEIGKRDILDRNILAMEPFNRNCSFRAVDMSYTRHMDGKLVSRYVFSVCSGPLALGISLLTRRSQPFRRAV